MTPPCGAKRIPFGLHMLSCPVTAVRGLTDMPTITERAVFRPVNGHGQVEETRLGDKIVALVVKRAALAAGLDPDQYAGHSLRGAGDGGGDERVGNRPRHSGDEVSRPNRLLIWGEGRCGLMSTAGCPSRMLPTA